MLLIFVPFFFTSCEVINPPEKIPSYLSVDTVMVQTNIHTEGSSTHNITDSWLYVNNKLIGVFEVPFTVPVLETGTHSIQIEPGIKNSGGDANRDIYPMMQGYSVDTFLTEGEILTLNPIHKYREVTVGLIEDFEDIGIELEVSSISDTTINLISGPEAFEGKSMHFCLDKDRPNFECKSSQLFEIAKNGPAFLEIDFKSNYYFTFGLFSIEYDGASMQEIRKRVFDFGPTDEWKKVYIDLSYYVNNAAGEEFRLFFICTRPENSELEEINVYVDNIKLLYLI